MKWFYLSPICLFTTPYCHSIKSNLELSICNIDKEAFLIIWCEMLVLAHVRCLSPAYPNKEYISEQKEITVNSYIFVIGGKQAFILSALVCCKANDLCVIVSSDGVTSQFIL